MADWSDRTKSICAVPNFFGGNARACNLPCGLIYVRWVAGFRIGLVVTEPQAAIILGRFWWRARQGLARRNSDDGVADIAGGAGGC